MIIPKNHYKIMPWKNGLGVTHEILISPEDSTLLQNNFHYRISSADIHVDAAFSTFKGKKRWLMVYEGNVIKLNQEELPCYEIKHFSGEENIFGSLMNGSIKDFGIIYDPNKVQVTMSLLQESREVDLRGENIFFCVGKSAHIFNQTLQHEDSLILKTPGSTLINLHPETKLIWISITHV
jgi:environmental stress-induced protein Ves